jgi:phosphoglycolate phosphatase
MKLLLFDIDGTLMLSGGAGVRAMNEAFRQMYGVAGAFDGVNLAGRTDTSILRDACRRFGFDNDEASETAFKELYASLLPEEWHKPIGVKRLMPGVEELMRHLHGRPGVILGPLTGNWQISGRIKLRFFGLDDYFPFGAFADDSELREELVPFAVSRCRLLYDWTPPGSEIYVIGDTPSDILCARPHGARSVAVAAAHYGIQDLAAYQPDYLLADLSDIDRVLEILT